MIAPQGHNLKYFCNGENQTIRRATASVNIYGEKLSFNVRTVNKDIVRIAIGEINVIEWDTKIYGTWLSVIGINDIKEALLKLKNEELISEEFYNNVAENFPKPGGGTINLLTDSYHTNHSVRQVALLRPFQLATRLGFLDRESGLSLSADRYHKDVIVRLENKRKANIALTPKEKEELQLSNDILTIGPCKAYHKATVTRLQNKIDSGVSLTEREASDFRFSCNLLKHGALAANALESKLKSTSSKITPVENLYSESFEEDNQQIPASSQLFPLPQKTNVSTHTQLIEWQYSYASFQQRLFTTIQEKRQDDEYVVLNKDEVPDQHLEIGITKQCSIM